MEREFVSYEQAVALKKIGFDKPCFKYIYTGDTGTNCNHYLEVEPQKAKNYNEDYLCISQPLFSQVFRWFRENHGLEIILRPDCFNHESKKLREYVIISYDKSWKLEAIAEPSHFVRKGCFNTPEEAENACIDKLIELAKQQSK